MGRSLPRHKGKISGTSREKIGKTTEINNRMEWSEVKTLTPQIEKYLKKRKLEKHRTM